MKTKNDYMKELYEKRKKFSGEIIKEAQKVISETGKLTHASIFIIADKFEMPVKTTYEILEGSNILALGAFQRAIDRGMKVRQIQKELKIGQFRE